MSEQESQVVYVVISGSAAGVMVRAVFAKRDAAVGRALGFVDTYGKDWRHAIEREGMLIGLGEARREAEESRTVRASEARFRALLEADPNAILALDENSRVTWATRIAGEQSNISHVNVDSSQGDHSTILFEVQVRDRAHLARLIRAIRGMPDVMKVERSLA